MSRWRDRAACLGADLDEFYPRPAPLNGKGSLRSDLTAQFAIRAYCDRCPVLIDCRRDILDAADARSSLLVGVWGGQWFDGDSTMVEITQMRRELQASHPRPLRRLSTDVTRHEPSPAEVQSNRSSSGTTGGKAPDLSTPASRRGITTQREPRRSPAQHLAATSNVLRRHALVRAAIAGLTERGVTWADAKAWALTAGFTRANLANVNPSVVDRYLADLDARAEVSA